MPKTASRPADAVLYEDDFYLWVERQADLLRKGRDRELDLAHLIGRDRQLAKIAVLVDRAAFERLLGEI